MIRSYTTYAHPLTILIAVENVTQHDENVTMETSPTMVKIAVEAILAQPEAWPLRAIHIVLRDAIDSDVSDPYLVQLSDLYLRRAGETESENDR